MPPPGPASVVAGEDAFGEELATRHTEKRFGTDHE